MKIRDNLNKYTISFLILSITLFGALSFFINKDIIDVWINYYVIFASGVGILILFFNNLEEFKWKNLKKVSLLLVLLTIFWFSITSLKGIRLNIETIKGLVNIACLLVVGYVISNIELSNSDKKFILNSIYLSFVICMILGIWQYFSGVNLIQYSNEIYPGILGRINSTFFIATILDKYIVLIEVLLFYSMIKNPKSIFYKVLLLLGAIGISLTFSRGGQLVFLFVLFLIFVTSLFKKQFFNAFSIIVTVISMFLIPGTSLSIQSGLDFVYEKINIPQSLRIDFTEIDKMFFKDIKIIEENHNDNEDGSSEPSNHEDPEPIVNQSLSYRKMYQEIGIQLMKDYPIFGIGIGNYSYLVNEENFANYITDVSVLRPELHYIYPHSAYIQLGAEVGIVGLILLIVTILSFVFYNDYRKNIFKVNIMLMFVGAMLIAGYTEGVFHSKQYIFVFMLILAFMASKKKNVKDDDYLNDLYAKTYNDKKEEFNKILLNNLKKNKKTFIVTANPEAFMIAESDLEYLKMLKDKNTTIVPDGIGLVKGATLLGYNITERIPGIDIASTLIKYCDELKKSIYLFGASKEVNEDLKKEINEKYPNVSIVGAKDGYIEDKDKVFKDIVKKSPDVVLVALGMPLQEKLIYKHLDKFSKGIFVGVGGSFDVLSGNKKRAPKLFQKLNLEWLYRIIKEPKRLGRFWNNNVKFLQKLNKTKNNEIF